jgi:hypothetical protein
MVKVGHPRSLKKTRDKNNLRLFEKSKGFPLFPSTKDHIYYWSLHEVNEEGEAIEV